MEISFARLNAFQWTHYVRVEKAKDGIAKISSRYFDGTGLTKPIVETIEYNTMIPLLSYQGKWSWAEIREERLQNFSPPSVTIDKLSWYHIRQDKLAVESLFQSWLFLDAIVPYTINEAGNNLTFFFTEGVCRIKKDQGKYGLKDGWIVTPPLPSSVVDSISNMRLRDIIDTPLIPECAVAVDAIGDENSCHIKYDVEVINLEKIFMKRSEILTKSRSSKFSVNIID